MEGSNYGSNQRQKFTVLEGGGGGGVSRRSKHWAKSGLRTDHMDSTTSRWIKGGVKARIRLDL